MEGEKENKEEIKLPKEKKSKFEAQVPLLKVNLGIIEEPRIANISILLLAGN